MPITQELWFSLFLLDLVVFGSVAVYAFYTYYQKLGELKRVQTDSYKKAQQILDEVKIKTQEILEKVEQKGDEILTDSELFKNDLNKDFKDSLKQSEEKYLQMVDEHSQKFLLDYENLLTSVKNQSFNKAGQALDSIENEVKKQLEEAKSSFKTEMMKTLSKVNEEIDQYKRFELEKVDHEIDALVIQIAKELLRLNLTPKDHKKLVMQALEKAKEQGQFFL